MQTRAAILFSALAGIFLLASCNREPAAPLTSAADASPAATAVAAASPAASTLPLGWTPDPAARLSASPNPVPAASAPGTATITWGTGGRPTAAVYVAADGGAEALFAEGSEGASDAAWIQAGHTYEFRLYTGTDRRQLLSRVTVTGIK